jgi:hypothetical protein
MAGKIKIPKSEFLAGKRVKAAEKIRQLQEKAGIDPEYPRRFKMSKEEEKLQKESKAITGAERHQQLWGQMATDTPEQRKERKVLSKEYQDISKEYDNFANIKNKRSILKDEIQGIRDALQFRAKDKKEREDLAKKYAAKEKEHDDLLQEESKLGKLEELRKKGKEFESKLRDFRERKNKHLAKQPQEPEKKIPYEKIPEDFKSKASDFLNKKLYEAHLKELEYKTRPGEEKYDTGEGKKLAKERMVAGKARYEQHKFGGPMAAETPEQRKLHKEIGDMIVDREKYSKNIEKGTWDQKVGFKKTDDIEKKLRDLRTWKETGSKPGERLHTAKINKEDAEKAVQEAQKDYANKTITKKQLTQVMKASEKANKEHEKAQQESKPGELKKVQLEKMKLFGKATKPGQFEGLQQREKELQQGKGVSSGKGRGFPVGTKRQRARGVFEKTTQGWVRVKR